MTCGVGGNTCRAAMFWLLPARAVCAPYDGLSIGILSSLKGVGYGSAEQPMPVVTGQDAEVPSVRSVSYTHLTLPTSDLV